MYDVSSFKKISVPLSVGGLRNCFRREVIGDRSTDSYASFWSAVALYGGDPSICQVDKPTSARSMSALRPAYGLVVRDPS